VNADPAIPAAYRTKDAIEFYLQTLTDNAVWENSVTMRSTRGARMYEPGNWVPRVSIVALNDTITVTDLALAAYERAPEPKKLALIPGGHFDPYLSNFEQASAAARAWFRSHLVN
jgi:uncharacterized protein